MNVILQAAFFHLSGIIPESQAEACIEEAVRKTYFAKGEEVVARNIAAIRAGFENVREAPVPERWKTLDNDEPAPRADAPAVVTRLLDPLNAQKGDDLPVSAFLGYEDGQMDMGLTAWEKRDIAVHVPRWNAEACVQCNRCSFVCPHAVIRPYPSYRRRSRPRARRSGQRSGPGQESRRPPLHSSDQRVRLHGLRKLRFLLPRRRQGACHDAAGRGAGKPQALELRPRH